LFKVRSHDPRPLRWWLAQRENIDMNPIYQRRGGLWTPRDRGFLVDSIINDFDIPKFYLADFSYSSNKLNKKRCEYAVIDGKQRFETLFGFLNGAFALNDDFVYIEDRRLKLGGLTYQDLAHSYPQIAEKVDLFVPSVVSVITNDESRIREMFVRLNRSKPLTGAEVRNAMSGPVPHLIAKIAAHEFLVEDIRFATNRGQDLNVAAKLLLVEHRGKLIDTKKKQLDELVREGERDESVHESAKNAMLNMDRMLSVFAENDPLLSSQGQIVVYYWLVRGLDDYLIQGYREFLIGFSRELKENRERLKRKEKNVDEELVRFQELSRSVNDQGSLEGRVEILLNKQSDWFSPGVPRQHSTL